MPVFLDSNIVLDAFDRGDPRRTKARSLLDAGFCASAQVLNEFASVGFRKSKLAWPEIAEMMVKLARLADAIVPLTAELSHTAVGIAERYKLNFYDALIVAAALHADCDTLYSEDMQDGLVIERRLTIRNPFADLPQA